MPVYKCPAPSCTIAYEGSITDIVLPAKMHSRGSHNIALEDADVATIIAKEADGDYEGASLFFLPAPIQSEPEKEEEVTVHKDTVPSELKYKIRKNHDWWKKQ